MHKAGKIALGCLLAPIGFLVLMVFFFATLRMAGTPDPNPQQRSLSQDLPEVATELVSTPVGDDTIEELQFDEKVAVDVAMDLEEGYFEIIAGPAEEGIRIDADYDEGSYLLEQDYGTHKGRPSYTLSFKSRISFWRRIAADGSWTDEDMEQNHVTVQLPRDTPMLLHMKIAKSDSEIDLTGLALVQLSIDFDMGEYQIDCREYNPVVMQEAHFKTAMGEFRTRGLAEMRARSIRLEGAMGEMSYDFGGDLLQDTELITRARLGEMRLRLPENAKWDPTSSMKATWGEAPPTLENPGTPGPEAPLLTLDCRVFMGELSYDSYRPRGSALRDRERD